MKKLFALLLAIVYMVSTAGAAVAVYRAGTNGCTSALSDAHDSSAEHESHECDIHLTVFKLYKSTKYFPPLTKVKVARSNIFQNTSSHFISFPGITSGVADVTAGTPLFYRPPIFIRNCVFRL